MTVCGIRGRTDLDGAKLVRLARLIVHQSDKVIANMQLLIVTLGVRAQGRHQGCHMEHNYRHGRFEG